MADFTLPDDYLTVLKGYENPSGDPTAQNPNSTASGAFQFTDPTWHDVVTNKHPELGLVDGDKLDPEAQAKVAAAYATDNAPILAKQLGRDPTSQELALAHFLGPGGAVKVLTADPATSVKDVVGEDAFNANQGVFTDKAGNPITVGQLLSNRAVATPAATASAAPAQPYNPLGFIEKLYTQGAGLLGNQQKNINDYIAGQPAVWDKLAALQKQYADAAKPTLGDSLSDMFTSYAQAKSAADANKLATQGGVLTGQLPDATAFNNAMAQQHKTDLEQRQAKIDLAKTAMAQGTQNAMAQLQQGGTNVGLQTGLAQQMVQFALSTGKLAQAQAQMGLDAASKFETALKEIIPNDESRAKLAPYIFQATKDTPLDFNGNLQKAQQIAAAAQSGKIAGLGQVQITQNQPAKMFQVEYADEKGNPVRVSVNAATPQGQADLQRLTAVPGARVTDLSAPQSNVQLTNNPPGAGGEGGGKQHSPADLHLAAIQTKQASDAALAILPFLKEAGGTGVLTDTPQARFVLNAAKQALGYDPVNLSPREIFDKLVTQIQVGQVLPMMTQLGRGTGGEFQKFLTGQIGSDYTPEAIKTFLEHVSETADWNKRLIEDTSNAAYEAKKGNNNYFDPDQFRIKWQSQPGNQPPTWNTSEVTNQKPTEEAHPTIVGRVIQNAMDGFTNWLKGHSPERVPAARSAQGNPATAPAYPPLDNDLRKQFRGQ